MDAEKYLQNKLPNFKNLLKNANEECGCSPQALDMINSLTAAHILIYFRNLVKNGITADTFQADFINNTSVFAQVFSFDKLRPETLSKLHQYVAMYFDVCK